jgi:RNA polymerase sigma-70 factor (ECF subfamily)
VVSGIDRFRKDRPCDTFRGWLRTITRSKLSDYFRRLKCNPAAVGGTGAQWRMEQVSEEPQGGAGEGEGDGEGEEAQRLAEQALFYRGLEKIQRHFDPQTWQAFWRVVVEGATASEAGEALGMRPGTVRVAKSRVLQRLRRELGDID